jgi:UDP-glucose 4-epimerase
MKSLVTGGAGFIGSHIVDKLINLGHEVRVIDDESAECNETFYKNPKAQHHKIDICDFDGILPIFSGIDYVFHLAAESRIQPTLARPQRACQVNVTGTCNVLQAARINNAKKVVYSSTSSAYGLKNVPPLKEDMSRDCLNPYSVTKVAAEDLCKMYYSLFNLPTVIFRYFNVYGERQPLKGQYAPVIGIFLRQKAAGESMTVVGDGLQRRDFTHVSDVVDANINAAFDTNPENLGQIFNIGTGRNHNMLELCEMIGGKYKFIAPRLGEARITLADISKAEKSLNYYPKVTLEKWIQENR